MRISYLPGCYHLIKKNKERGRCVVFNQATQLFSLSKLVMHDKGFVLIVARNSETRLFIDLYLLSSLLSLVSSVTCYLPVTLGWRISSLFQIPYLLFSSSQSSLLFDVTQRKTQFRNSLSLSLILIWMLNEGDNFIRLISWRRSLIFLDLILRQESFRPLQLKKKNRNREECSRRGKDSFLQSNQWIDELHLTLCVIHFTLKEKSWVNRCLFHHFKDSVKRVRSLERNKDFCFLDNKVQSTNYCCQ